MNAISRFCRRPPLYAPLAFSKQLDGVCCSGLSAQYRSGGVQPLANAVGAELAIATGALDLWVADVQDVYPGIMAVAECFHTKAVTTSASARLPGAIRIEFDHEHGNLGEARDLARRIVGLAVESAWTTPAPRACSAPWPTPPDRLGRQGAGTGAGLSRPAGSAGGAALRLLAQLS